MKKIIELPLIEPLYSAYHFQGPGTATLVDNPSLRNWYLDHAVILACSKKFLKGFTTPELNILDSSWGANPYLEKKRYEMEFLNGYVHYVIRNLLNEGYYVCFSGVDDYFVEGKSWYKERHFYHDGTICGYNQMDKTYCIYAYDNNWIYRKFWTSQSSFEKGRQSMFKEHRFGFICGIKPQSEQVCFSSETALKKIMEYLDSSMEKYPEDSGGAVYGTAVHDYLANYIQKLHEGSIPYEKMDRRVFRIIWEHKKAMLERIRLIESDLQMENLFSESYIKVVQEAEHSRMLYAAHHMKRRDSVLPVIQRKLLEIKAYETEILEALLSKSKGKN